MAEQDTPPSGTPVVEQPESNSGGDPFEERPELFVAGAFVGGFALAQILKRIGNG